MDFQVFPEPDESRYHLRLDPVDKEYQRGIPEKPDQEHPMMQSERLLPAFQRDGSEPEPAEPFLREDASIQSG